MQKFILYNELIMKSVCLTIIIAGFLVSGCWWFQKPPETPPPPIPWEDIGISELQKRLYSEDSEHRALAADRLVIRGDKRAIRTISEALRTARDEIVTSILKVLAMRPDQRYIQPLIDVLETKHI
jgi:hypothetical protein